jgi:hypothetical protein
VLARTYGDISYGVEVETFGSGSDGVLASTHGEFSRGLWVKTFGPSSRGVIGETFGNNSEGVVALTYGYFSPGVYGFSFQDVGVYGEGKEGAYFTTNQAGTASNLLAGVNVSTRYNYNPGIRIDTTGYWSNGIIAETHNDRSNGVSAHTYGPNSRGVDTRTDGTNSPSIYALASQSDAIWAETQRADHKYGVRTPDIIRALNYETGSSDVAEYMPVTGEVEPGTVLVIGADGRLQVSTTAYDTGVAGIVSTAPGVSLGAKEEGNPGEALIAVAGRVPCKVDASNGPIHPRDLLTTSNRPGYAMKATDPKIGTILGKALGSLESGTGTIEVIVTLQ